MEDPTSPMFLPARPPAPKLQIFILHFRANILLFKHPPLPAVYSGILLSQKKEWNYTIYSGVSRPRVCCIEWSKSEREKQISYSFPGGSDGKESVFNAGALGSIPGLGRFPGGGHGIPLQYTCLENPHGQRGLVSYSPWGHKESGTAEQLRTAQYII